MILKIYDPQASIVKPRIISRMKDLGETFYVFFVILMISSMLGIVLEVTISPPFVIFSILWRLTARTDIFLWEIEILGSTLINVMYDLLCLVLSTSTFIGLFILLNLIINVIIQQIFDFLTSREYWVTLYVIFTILIRLKILGIIHIDIEYIMLLLLLNCLLSWVIELYCDVNPPPSPTVQSSWLERDVYALENNISCIFKTIQSQPTDITISIRFPIKYLKNFQLHSFSWNQWFTWKVKPAVGSYESSL